MERFAPWTIKRAVLTERRNMQPAATTRSFPSQIVQLTAEPLNKLAQKLGPATEQFGFSPVCSELLSIRGIDWYAGTISSSVFELMCKSHWGTVRPTWCRNEPIYSQKSALNYNYQCYITSAMARSWYHRYCWTEVDIETTIGTCRDLLECRSCRCQ